MDHRGQPNELFLEHALFPGAVDNVILLLGLSCAMSSNVHTDCLICLILPSASHTA